MIGVIADDLTGAAELGAIGLHFGLRTEIIVLNLPEVGGHVPAAPDLSDVDLVCIDTHSRSCSAEDAARRAEAAARLLQRGGAAWIYKKVDSVLRGQVVAEVEAVMKALDFKRTLLIPANPSLGRTIKRGRYYIHGKLIHKTEFARDPEHPRTSSDPLKLLGASTMPIRVCGIRETLPRAGIIVGATASTKDLKLWAARRSPSMLAAGGAEFFGTLLARRMRSTKAQPDAIPEVVSNGDRELFVCGTISDSARKFIRAARAGGTPVYSLPKELVWGAGFTPVAAEAISQKIVNALQSHPRVILNVGLRALRERTIARRLVSDVTQVAALVLRQADIAHIYAEGGATAAELSRNMGWSRLKVVRELAPGVATLAVGKTRTSCLTIKPGSYVWPQQVQNREASPLPLVSKPKAADRCVSTH